MRILRIVGKLHKNARLLERCFTLTDSHEPFEEKAKYLLQFIESNKNIVTADSPHSISKIWRNVFQGPKKTSIGLDEFDEFREARECLQFKIVAGDSGFLSPLFILYWPGKLTWYARTTGVVDVSKGLSMKDFSAIFPVHWTFVKTKTASTNYTSAKCPDKAAWYQCSCFASQILSVHSGASFLRSQWLFKDVHSQSFSIWKYTDFDVSKGIQVVAFNSVEPHPDSACGATKRA